MRARPHIESRVPPITYGHLVDARPRRRPRVVTVQPAAHVGRAVSGARLLGRRAGERAVLAAVESPRVLHGHPLRLRVRRAVWRL